MDGKIICVVLHYISLYGVLNQYIRIGDSLLGIQPKQGKGTVSDQLAAFDGVYGKTLLLGTRIAGFGNAVQKFVEELLAPFVFSELSIPWNCLTQLREIRA